MSNAQKAIKDPADPVGIPPAPMAIAPSAPVKEEDTVEIAVQVNGKVKARIKVAADIDNAAAIAAAKAEPAVAEFIAGKTVAKEIYVKGKLVNIAVKG